MKYLLSVSILFSLLLTACSSAIIDRYYNEETFGQDIETMIEQKEILELEGAQITLYVAQKKLEGASNLKENTYRQLLEQAKASKSGDAVAQIAFQVEKMADFAMERLLDEEVQGQIADGILRAQEEAVKVSQQLINNIPEIPAEVKDNFGKFLSWANVAREQGLPSQEEAKGIAEGLARGFGGFLQALSKSIGSATEQMDFNNIPSFKDFSSNIQTDGFGNISTENLDQYMENFAKEAFEELGKTMGEMGDVFKSEDFENLRSQLEATGQEMSERMQEWGENFGRELENQLQNMGE